MGNGGVEANAHRGGGGGGNRNGAGRRCMAGAGRPTTGRAVEAALYYTRDHVGVSHVSHALARARWSHTL